MSSVRPLRGKGATICVKRGRDATSWLLTPINTVLQLIFISSLALKSETDNNLVYDSHFRPFVTFHVRINRHNFQNKQFNLIHRDTPSRSSRCRRDNFSLCYFMSTVYILTSAVIE